MTRTLVEQIADAVLYEGYLLYPYRPSVKNRQRWTFGGLYPRSYSEAQEGTDPSECQTECLVAVEGTSTTVTVRVRFLQLQARREWRGDERAEIDVPAWQEAVEQEIDAGEFALEVLLGWPQRLAFHFPEHREEQPSRTPGGEILGVTTRERRPIEAAVEISAVRVADGLVKLTVRVVNESRFDMGDTSSRDDALMHSLVSTHSILGVRGGAFVSQIDPSEAWKAFASGCRNTGTWPVLVGEPGQTDTMLSAPIILYDYPQIAPESPGDLFDATEIDEILTLRILTLTDEEKSAMAAVDERARALLERTESMGQDQLMGLHGAIRSLRPI